VCVVTTVLTQSSSVQPGLVNIAGAIVGGSGILLAIAWVIYLYR